MLLQAFISQLKLEGFALMADMVYVTQVQQDLHLSSSGFDMLALKLSSPLFICVTFKMEQFQSEIIEPIATLTQARFKQ